MSEQSDVIEAFKSPAVDRPLYPSSRAEFITIVAHYHRAEIARMAGWRDRIDRTTNWAITVVAAMLSLSLSASGSHHGVLLFGMALVGLLLYIESRRYRFFDVYRRRVRSLERNYFAHAFSPVAEPSLDWTAAFAMDLRQPRFMLTRGQALARRLQRNYCWMFFILLAAWLVKISSAKLQYGEAAHDSVAARDVIQNAALGPVPGYVVVAFVLAFYVGLLLIIRRGRRNDGDVLFGPVYV